MDRPSRQVKRAAARAGHPLPPPKEPWRPLKMQDAIGLLAIPLAIAAMLSENNTAVAVCIGACWLILCLPVIWHPEIPKEYRFIWCVLSAFVWFVLYFLIQGQNLAKELAQNEGTLEAASDVVKDDCPQFSHFGAFALRLGTEVIFINGFPRNIINLAGQDILTVRLEKNGKLKIVTLRLYDDRGDIISRIDENDFWIAPTLRKKHPDKSTLIIFDHNDDEVLHIRFQNPHALYVLGMFRYRGRAVYVAPNLLQVGGIRGHGSCSMEGGSGIIRVN
jgi:hypothetical protein